MKYGLYCTRDVKRGFLPPQIDENDQTALRNFAYAVNNNGLSSFAPKDFQHYKVGVFDSDTGEIEKIYPVVLIADGMSVIGDSYEK